MLYLHCGWPRTSTSSIQAALFEQTDRLAAAGLVYPDRWRVREGGTHHGLAELLVESQRSESVLDDFRTFLTSCDGKDILLSAEALTGWLRSSERLRALLRLLGVAREVCPIRCIWTLRRYDEVIGSLYLQHAVFGTATTGPSPAEFFARVSRLDDFFGGMRKVEDAVDGEVIYVKYEADGWHNRELLRAFGLPAWLRAEIEESLEDAPRLNSSPSQKQAIIERNLDALSARAGVDLDRVAMRDAFYRGTFRFEEDQRCELIDGDARREVHERALAAALRAGLTAYVELFGEVEVRRSSAVELDPEIVTDEDLYRLAGHLGSKRTLSSSASLP